MLACRQFLMWFLVLLRDVLTSRGQILKQSAAVTACEHRHPDQQVPIGILLPANVLPESGNLTLFY